MGATDLYIELFAHDVTQGSGGGGVTDHGALTSIGLNTHAQVDNHIADGSIHGGGGATDHTALTNIGTNTHAQLDGHVADTAIHFNEASIDHDAIQNNGTNTHAQVDAHLADATVHFTEASIQHNEIQGAGANTHVSIDQHIDNLNVHLKNNTAAVDPTATDDSSLGYSVFSQWINSDTSKVFVCDQTTVGSAVWIDVTAAGGGGVTDHAALTNIGTNTHPQIDTHIADGSIHAVIEDALSQTDTILSSSEIDDRIAANGGGLPAADGTTLLPSISFASDQDTGAYRFGTNEFAITTGGVTRVIFGPLTATYKSPLLAPQGSASSTAYGIEGSPGTGMYQQTAGQLNFSVNGTEALRLNPTFVRAQRPLEILEGTISVPGLGFFSETSTGIYRPGNRQLGITVDAASMMIFDSVGVPFITVKGRFQQVDGAVNRPAYGFSSNGNTGMYLVAANRVGFTTGGVHRAEINADGGLLMASATGAAPTAGQINAAGLFINGVSVVGGGGSASGSSAADIYGQREGALTIGTDLLTFTVPRNIELPASTQIYWRLGTAGTSNLELNVLVDGVVLRGSVMTAGSTSSIMTSIVTDAVAAGSVITVRCIEAATDPTASDLSLTVVATVA